MGSICRYFIDRLQGARQLTINSVLAPNRGERGSAEKKHSCVQLVFARCAVLLYRVIAIFIYRG